MNDNRMKIPLFPLEVVLFPGAALPLHIFEDRYREMIGECLARKGSFGVVQAQRDGLAVIGCTAEIISVLNRYPDGSLDILCQGLERFEIENLDNSRSFLQAEVDLFADDDLPANRALREECMAMHFEVRELLGGDPASAAFDLDQPISFQLASAAPANFDFKQELLGIRSDAERTERLHVFYCRMLPKLRRGAQASKIATHNGHVM
jgi:Lon protease-like protein